MSDFLHVNHGVPQGAILGPLMFIIFYNVLFFYFQNEIEIILYADDTTIVVSAFTIEDLKCKVEQTCEKLRHYLKFNGLFLNTSKSKMMTFSFVKNDHQLFSDICGIECVSNFYLAISPLHNL